MFAVSDRAFVFGMATLFSHWPRPMTSLPRSYSLSICCGLSSPRRVFAEFFFEHGWIRECSGIDARRPTRKADAAQARRETSGNFALSVEARKRTSRSDSS